MLMYFEWLSSCLVCFPNDNNKIKGKNRNNQYLQIHKYIILVWIIPESDYIDLRYEQ